MKFCIVGAGAIGGFVGARVHLDDGDAHSDLSRDGAYGGREADRRTAGKAGRGLLNAPASHARHMDRHTKAPQVMVRGLFPMAASGRDGAHAAPA